MFQTDPRPNLTRLGTDLSSLSRRHHTIDMPSPRVRGLPTSLWAEKSSPSQGLLMFVPPDIASRRKGDNQTLLGHYIYSDLVLCDV